MAPGQLSIIWGTPGLSVATADSALAAPAVTDPGECTATLAIPTPSATDNCPGVTVAGVRSDGKAIADPYPAGNTLIIWTATDASGNTASCEQKVVVYDFELPQITCPANLTATTEPSECFGYVSLTTPTATDNCPGVTVIGKRSDGQAIGEPFPTGTTTVTWQATDASGNTAECEQTVKVGDEDPPYIACPKDITAETDTGTCLATIDPGKATAHDACSPAVTLTASRSDGEELTAPFPVGVTFITWTAADMGGNVSTCKQRITVFDVEYPAITCPLSKSDCLKGINGNTVDVGQATATDNCPGVTVAGVRDDGKALTDLYPAGKTTITWTATDASGNKLTCEQWVIITGAKIKGVKFYDANNNGMQDEGEGGINGFKIVLTGTDSAGNNISETQYTANDGSKDGAYCFIDLPFGSYSVKEIMPSSSWKATVAESFNITIDDCNLAIVRNFGNVCLGSGNAKTIGFWQSNNGQKTMNNMPGEMAGTLSYLSGLNLRTASGNHFDPANFNTYRNWLKAADASNMAYMLSAQMAAMELNLRAEFVDAGALVNAPGTNSADTAGLATIGNLLTEANTELGLHGLAMSDASWRDYQEALMKAIDNANNNRNFVCDGPGSFSSPY